MSFHQTWYLCFDHRLKFLQFDTKNKLCRFNIYQGTALQELVLDGWLADKYVFTRVK